MSYKLTDLMKVLAFKICITDKEYVGTPGYTNIIAPINVRKFAHNLSCKNIYRSDTKFKKAFRRFIKLAGKNLLLNTLNVVYPLTTE